MYRQNEQVNTFWGSIYFDLDSACSQSVVMLELWDEKKRRSRWASSIATYHVR